MQIIDSHAHVFEIKDYVNDTKFIPVVSGYSNGSNLKTIKIAKEYKYPFCLGIAPQTVLKEGIDNLDLWISEIRKEKPNAIGEVGLDFHWAETEEKRTLQKQVFSQMIDLSSSMKLPVVLHSRDATKECLDMLEEKDFKYKIMLHFFSGTVEDAVRVSEQGGVVSFPPVRSKKRKDTLLKIPLENIVVETDAPFVGRTIQDVVDSINYVAEIKNLDFDIVAMQTAKNASKFFRI